METAGSVSGPFGEAVGICLLISKGSKTADGVEWCLIEWRYLRGDDDIPPQSDESAAAVKEADDIVAADTDDGTGSAGNVSP